MKTQKIGGLEIFKITTEYNNKKNNLFSQEEIRRDNRLKGTFSTVTYVSRVQTGFVGFIDKKN